MCLWGRNYPSTAPGLRGILLDMSEARFRRIYFDVDVFNERGERIDQFCSCSDVAPGTSDFDAWAEIVGDQTKSALLTAEGDPAPRSLRVDVRFTHWFWLDLDGKSLSAPEHEEPLDYPEAWTAEVSDDYAGFAVALRTLNTVGFMEYGSYPWDFWKKVALRRGLDADLVELGRSLFREASQHSWRPSLWAICGYDDFGERMILLALRDPKRAERRWSWLMSTDGERVEPETFQLMEELPENWGVLRRQHYRNARAEA